MKTSEINAIITRGVRQIIDEVTPVLRGVEHARMRESLTKAFGVALPKNGHARTLKRSKAQMRCTYTDKKTGARCAAQSRGPRFHYLCKGHEHTYVKQGDVAKLAKTAAKKMKAASVKKGPAKKTIAAKQVKQPKKK